MFCALSIASFALVSALPQEPEWHGTADAGLVLLSGNNSSSTATIRGEAKLEEGTYRWILGLLYSGVRQSEQSTGISSTTSRLLDLSAEHHRFFDDANDFYAYGKGSGRSDEPNGLSHRTDVGLGIGHTWRWDEGKTSLNFEGGPSMVRENNVGALSDSAWTSRLAARLDSPLSDKLTLTSKVEYFQSMSRAEDASATTECGLRWSLAGDWFLQFTSSLSWDGTPAPGFEQTDYRQSFTLGTSF
jgi:putative salt-induced outer membrane protein YdiY|tara:strand:- start:30868 stop:31599 length:732 start_codon:yes stop_codon:yes gene_type:complete